MCDLDQATKNRMDLDILVTRCIWEDLLGVATKKMRGITSNYQDEFLEIIVFFESELTKEEDNEMRRIHRSVISNAIPIVYDFKSEPIFTVKEVGLRFIIIPSSIDIFEKMGNVGWHYLRKEY